MKSQTPWVKLIAALEGKRSSLCAAKAGEGPLFKAIFTVACFLLDAFLVFLLIPFVTTKFPTQSFQYVARFTPEQGFVDSYDQHLQYYRAGIAASTLAVSAVALKVISILFVAFLSANPELTVAAPAGGGGGCPTPITVDWNAPFGDPTVTVGTPFDISGHFHDSDSSAVCAAVVSAQIQYNDGAWQTMSTSCGANEFCVASDVGFIAENHPPTDHTAAFTVSATPRESGTFTIRLNVQNTTSSEKTVTANCPAAETAPGDVSHSANTSSSITWTWVDNATSEDSYQLEDASGVDAVTGIPANSTSREETGLAANTQYTRHATAVNCLNSAQESDGNDGSAYTSIETPAGATFSGVSTSAITVASSTALTNLTAGSSGVYFSESVTGTNSGWRTTNSWGKTGLTANTQYSFSMNARNGDGDEVGIQGPFTKYTAAVNADTNSARSANTWYTSDGFTVTNNAAWGAGGVQYYRYVMNQNADYTFTGSESTWSDADAKCPGGACTTTGTSLTVNAGSDATDWYLHVQAYNGDDEASTAQTHGPFFLDRSAPDPPATLNDGAGADASWTTSKNGLTAHWSAVSDAMSGFSKYQYAIGTTSGGTDVVNWTDNGTSTSVTKEGLTLADGDTYYVSVRAVDAAENTSSVKTSDGITVDATDPTITDNEAGVSPARASGGTTYDIDFSNGGSGSELDYAQYAVGSAPGGTDVKTWTDIFTADTASYTADWKIDFASLQEGVNYVSVRTADVAGNLKTMNDVFTVNKDTVNPTVSGVSTSSTQTAITVRWTTSEPTTTQVEWGSTDSYGNFSAKDETLTTDHAVTVSSLSAGETYHFRVLSEDSAGNAVASADQTASTNTVTPTSITNVQSEVLSPTSVRITWTTNHAADSKVRYGTTTAYGGEVYDATPVTSHSVTVTDLDPNTTYHYEVLSVGNTSTNDADATFTTTARTTISGVNASASATSVTITWTTNHAATGTVRYGTTPDYGASESESGTETSHSITIAGLIPETVYHYRIESIGNSTATTADATFTTAAATGILEEPVNVELNETETRVDSTFNDVGVAKAGTLTLSGVAEPFSTIIIRIASADAFVTTTTADANGEWSVVVPVKDTPLDLGTHEVFATVTKGESSSGEVKIAEFDLTTSAYLPSPTILTPEEGEDVIDPRPRITGLARSGNTVHLYIDDVRVATLTATTDDSGTGSFGYRVPRDLAAGSHTIHAVAVSGDSVSQNSPDRTFAVAAPFIGITFTGAEFVAGTPEPYLAVRGIGAGGSRVDFFLNDEFLDRIGLLHGHDVTETFTYKIYANNLVPKDYQLYAIAYDENGKPSRKSNVISFTKSSDAAADFLVTDLGSAPVASPSGRVQPPAGIGSGPGGTYTVQAGDSLWKIARELLGSGARYSEIVALNSAHYPSLLNNANYLAVGWTLVIP